MDLRSRQLADVSGDCLHADDINLAPSMMSGTRSKEHEYFGPHSSFCIIRVSVFSSPTCMHSSKLWRLITSVRTQESASVNRETRVHTCYSCKLGIYRRMRGSGKRTCKNLTTCMLSVRLSLFRWRLLTCSTLEVGVCQFHYWSHRKSDGFC
jgi:hypothetical protein